MLTVTLKALRIDILKVVRELISCRKLEFLCKVNLIIDSKELRLIFIQQTDQITA